MKKLRKPKPTNPKVVAGGLGAALSSFVVWLTGVMFFDASSVAGKADQAIASVPWPVSTLEATALALAFAWFKTDNTDEAAKRGFDWGSGKQDADVAG